MSDLPKIKKGWAREFLDRLAEAWKSGERPMPTLRPMPMCTVEYLPLHASFSPEDSATDTGLWVEPQ